MCFYWCVDIDEQLLFGLCDGFGHFIVYTIDLTIPEVYLECQYININIDKI